MSWDPFTEQWEKGFIYLQAFVKEKGHCRVPVNYITEDGYNLGSWVGRQRRNIVKISEERKNRLKMVGFY